MNAIGGARGAFRSNYSNKKVPSASTVTYEGLFNENYSSDWYIGAEDAVTYGIASKIIKSLDEIF